MDLIPSGEWISFRAAFATGPEGMGVAIVLPTGRPLFYRSMQKRPEVTPRGLEDVYRYVDFYSFDAKASGRGNKKARKCGDGRLRTSLDPQTIIENVVQAIARDLLVAQMRDVERHGGIRPRFSVHDEGVFATAACVCPRRDGKRDKGVAVEALHEPGCAWVRGRQLVKAEMSKVPACLVALRELPVACELSDTIRDSYGK